MTTMPGLFVTGTDTGVGKTWVASAIARSLVRAGRTVGVLKPVATGAAREGDSWRCDDAEALIAAAGGGIPIERVAPLLYEEPLAPAVAARRRGTPLTMDRVRQAVAESLAWWSGRAEILVVEGVGGLLCPLAEGTTVADLAVTLDYPLVIVARRGLGTLNHTLLTVEAARRRALRVTGIILNGAEPTRDPAAEATNADELARRLDGQGIAILGEIRHHAEHSGWMGSALDIDWYGRAGSPRRLESAFGFTPPSGPPLPS